MVSARAAGNWRTKDGQRKEIAWMDSVHLMHSLNMVSRAALGYGHGNRWQANSIFREAKRRGLANHTSYVAGTQFPVPERRETPAELCMLNALIEHGMFSEVPALRSVPEHVFKNVQRNHPEVWKTYAKHRLTR